jgi:hypothetical protein
MQAHLNPGCVIKLVLEYSFFLRVSFRPERSGVEESAVLPGLPDLVEKGFSAAPLTVKL